MKTQQISISCRSISTPPNLSRLIWAVFDLLEFEELIQSWLTGPDSVVPPKPGLSRSNRTKLVELDSPIIFDGNQVRVTSSLISFLFSSADSGDVSRDEENSDQTDRLDGNSSGLDDVT